MISIIVSFAEIRLVIILEILLSNFPLPFLLPDLDLLQGKSKVPRIGIDAPGYGAECVLGEKSEKQVVLAGGQTERLIERELGTGCICYTADIVPIALYAERIGFPFWSARQETGNTDPVASSDSFQHEKAFAFTPDHGPTFSKIPTAQ